MPVKPEYISKVQQRTYATTVAGQRAQLKTDPLLKRFAESRSELSADPYRPAYHYVNPEGNLNDPNGLCHWQGRYHLFYQAYPPEDTRQHWGHAVSDDLVRWEDLPLAIFPGIERCCFSGSTLAEDDRVIAMYHGTGAGNMVAVSEDPLLLNWEKIPGNPVIPGIKPDENGRPYRVYDPCIWREEEGYYTLSGSYVDGPIFGTCRMAQHLFFSKDLRHWDYLGPFIEGDVYTGPGEDGAVPYFWPIGDKHILVFASHQRGSQYLIGDYDRLKRKFSPTRHGRFNFGAIDPGAVHAPTAMPDGEGGIYVIHNINEGKPCEGWNHIMSLPRRLTLLADGTLEIVPVASTQSLRTEHRQVGETALPANQEVLMGGIDGNVMELILEVDPKNAREVSVNVLRSSGGEETTTITFYRNGLLQFNDSGHRFKQDALSIDISRASLLPDVYARPEEIAPFALGEEETLKLRIFIDRSVIEVFANGQQCLALRVYPSREDSTGVSLEARGAAAVLRGLDAWGMETIWG